MTQFSAPAGLQDAQGQVLDRVDVADHAGEQVAVAELGERLIRHPAGPDLATHDGCLDSNEDQNDVDRLLALPDDRLGAPGGDSNPSRLIRRQCHGAVAANCTSPEIYRTYV